MGMGGIPALPIHNVMRLLYIFFVLLLNVVKNTNIIHYFVLYYCIIQIYVVYLYRNQKQNNKMKAKKYIDLSLKVRKAYEGKNYINRYMHLLNVVAPNKYQLDTMNMLASIENNETGLTVVLFSDNPFKR